MYIYIFIYIYLFVFSVSLVVAECKDLITNSILHVSRKNVINTKATGEGIIRTLSTVVASTQTFVHALL